MPTCLDEAPNGKMAAKYGICRTSDDHLCPCSILMRANFDQKRGFHDPVWLRNSITCSDLSTNAIARASTTTKGSRKRDDYNEANSRPRAPKQGATGGARPFWAGLAGAGVAAVLTQRVESQPCSRSFPTTFLSTKSRILRRSTRSARLLDRTRRLVNPTTAGREPGTDAWPTFSLPLSFSFALLSPGVTFPL